MHPPLFVLRGAARADGDSTKFYVSVLSPSAVGRPLFGGDVTPFAVASTLYKLAMVIGKPNRLRWPEA